MAGWAGSAWACGGTDVTWQETGRSENLGGDRKAVAQFDPQVESRNCITE